MSAVALRRATPEDVRLIFEWRNDPGIVALGSSQRTITWEEHTAWFNNVLTSPEHQLWIILIKQVPAGVVRFDYQPPHAATVSIYLMPPFVGHGDGTIALQLACDQAFAFWGDLHKIVACIREDNAPSLRSFSKTGFIRSEAEETCAHDHILMLKERVDRYVE